MQTDRAGREIPKDYRAIINHLIDTQGWRYKVRKGGHPVLYPANRQHAPITMPGSPSDHRALDNFKAAVRRAGGRLT